MIAFAEAGTLHARVRLRVEDFKQPLWSDVK